jgi:hypothetical protein
VREVLAGYIRSYDETAILVTPVQGLETLVLAGEGTLARGVDDQYDLALVGIAEVDDLIPGETTLFEIQRRCTVIRGNAVTA